MKHIEYLLVGLLTVAFIVGSFVLVPYVLGTTAMRLVSVAAKHNIEEGAGDIHGFRWFVGFFISLGLVLAYATGTLVLQ